MADKKDHSHEFDALSTEEMFETGISQFNNQEYFECHEVLEALWNRQDEPEKQFTQGVIQIAVALYHTGRGNFVGANKLLSRGLARVRPFAPKHLGLDIETFLRTVESIQQQTIDHEQLASKTPMAFPAPQLAHGGAD